MSTARGARGRLQVIEIVCTRYPLNCVHALHAVIGKLLFSFSCDCARTRPPYPIYASRRPRGAPRALPEGGKIEC
jgi:hypothetical protein